jgi:hypothetical protein
MPYTHSKRSTSQNHLTAKLPSDCKLNILGNIDPSPKYGCNPGSNGISQGFKEHRMRLPWFIPKLKVTPAPPITSSCMPVGELHIIPICIWCSITNLSNSCMNLGEGSYDFCDSWITIWELLSAAQENCTFFISMYETTFARRIPMEQFMRHY